MNLGDISFNLLGMLSGLMEGQSAVAEAKYNAAAKEKEANRKYGLEYTKMDVEDAAKQRELNIKESEAKNAQKYQEGVLANERQKNVIEGAQTENTRKYQEGSLKVANDEKNLRDEIAHLQRMLEELRAIGTGRGKGKGKGISFDFNGDGIPDRSGYLLGAMAEMVKDPDSIRMLKNPEDFKSVIGALNSAYDIAFPQPKEIIPTKMQPSHTPIGKGTKNKIPHQPMADFYGGGLNLLRTGIGSAFGAGFPFINMSVPDSISPATPSSMGPPVPSHGMPTPVQDVDPMIQDLLRRTIAMQNPGDIPLGSFFAGDQGISPAGGNNLPMAPMAGELNFGRQTPSYVPPTIPQMNAYESPQPAPPQMNQTFYGGYGDATGQPKLEDILMLLKLFDSDQNLWKKYAPDSTSTPLVTNPRWMRKQRGQNLMKTLK